MYVRSGKRAHVALKRGEYALPARFTIDENGCVLNVEYLPALESVPLPAIGKKSGNKEQPKRKTSPPSRKVAKRPQQPLGARSVRGPWTKCRICGSKLLERNFDKHRKKLHASDVEPLPSTSKTTKTASKKAKNNRSKTTKPLPVSRGGRKDRTGRDINLQGQALRQSFEDSSYGDKGLGHMRREQGKFGSLPLYDDYSEESWAD